MTSFNLHDVVRVSDDAVRSGRPFDFGIVIGTNEDGTYRVSWDSAGCSCNGVPNESADQLTSATNDERDAFYYHGTVPDGVVVPALSTEDAHVIAPVAQAPEDEEWDEDDYDDDEDWGDDDDHIVSSVPDDQVYASL